MNEHLRTEVWQLRRQVANAEYQVDSRAVATAIVRRRWAVAVARKPAQTRVISTPSWDRIEALAA
jgi:hypothetical protein